MSKNLVIVESPAKAKTIEKYLGSEFKVSSSYGHISDLPKKEIGIDFENNFKPKYIISSDKKDIVRENIEKGGIICDFKPRTTINKKISSRFFTDFVRPPCDYLQDIETEFYLIHGENSNYSSRYWKDRHETKSNII